MRPWTRARSEGSVHLQSVKATGRRFVLNQLRRRDIGVIRHSFANRLVSMLAAHDIRTVIDVGANIGQYAVMLRGAGYDGQLISCEPAADVYKVLQHRARRDLAWQTARTALGSSPGSATINVSQESQTSSFLLVNQAVVEAVPSARTIRTEEVSVTTLDDLVAGLDLDLSRTFLKLDVQGFESSVLDGAHNCLRSLAGVQLELSLVPCYQGQALFDDLLMRLRSSGFELCALEGGFSDPTTGRMMQCDGIFFREDR